MAGTSSKHIAVPTFRDAEQVRHTYRKRLDIRGLEGEDFERSPLKPGDIPDLYPRDGFNSLARMEDQIRSLVGVGEGSLLAYPTGMTAVVAAIEAKYPTAGSTMILGKEHYTEIPRYADVYLRPRGVNVVRVDSGNSKEVEAAIIKYSPDIVLFETITNSTAMPVLDIDSVFRSMARISGSKTIFTDPPLLILDNTLATPTLLPPSVLLGDGSVSVAVVESGTKSYAMNSEMLGILYTNRRQLWTQLFSGRITVGATPSPSAVATISHEMPSSKEGFDARNLVIFRNNLVLARAAASAAQERPELTVEHPNIQPHPNYAIANSINPKGVSPVFYISIGTDQFKLVDFLLEDPLIRRHCEISQSFGFDSTRIYPYYGSTYVRIAGGTHNVEQIEELGQALRTALLRA